MIEHVWRRSKSQSDVWRCATCGIEILWFPDGDQLNPIDDPAYDHGRTARRNNELSMGSVLSGAHLHGYTPWAIPDGAPRDCGFMIIREIMES